MEGIGGEGGIRTHVPLTGQDAFEAPPLRPLRYLSGLVRAGLAARLYENISLYLPCRSRRAPLLTKELLDGRAALVFEHTAGHHEPVVETRVLERADR